MAQQYDDTNKGALFGNNRKREGKKDPDLQGKLNIDGQDRWLSGWFFTYEKDGEKKRGINISLGAPVEAKNNNPVSNLKSDTTDDDDIPF